MVRSFRLPFVLSQNCSFFVIRSSAFLRNPPDEFRTTLLELTTSPDSRRELGPEEGVSRELVQEE
jgi:hypothetical protein